MLAMGIASSCAQAPPEVQIINDAAEALGGKSKIAAVNTLVLEGTGTNGNLGQNRTPEADLPVFQVSQFKRTIDLANGRARQEQTRLAVVPPGAPPAQPQQQNLGLDGDVAFNVAADGKPIRVDARVAGDRRNEFILHHPIGALRAALDPAAKVTNPRQAGDLDVVDITTAQGEHLTLAVTRATHRPASVTSMTYNVNLGDVAIETTFGDYEAADGLMLPKRLTSKLDKYPNTDITLSKQTVNASVSGLAAAEAVKAAPAPVVAANVTVEQVGKGLWLLAGQSHNSVLVEFVDHTELIEVPQHETRSLAVIAKARELKPDKPLTKVIMTHHHFDHSGGIRAAIAEGLTLVTHERNRAFIEDMAQRKHSIVQDALARKPAAPKIETVGDELTVKDAAQTMQLFKVDDPTAHSDSMLMAYFPIDKVLVQADFYNTAGAAQPRAPALSDIIMKRKLAVAKHVPIHGVVKTQAEFMKVVQSMKAPAAD
jgi:glyoxylase-like metal-dependent hydrolase (beta-lactamase superfamily II)